MEAYLRSQETTPSLTAVVQTALRQFLIRRRYLRARPTVLTNGKVLTRAGPESSWTIASDAASLGGQCAKLIQPASRDAVAYAPIEQWPVTVTEWPHCPHLCARPGFGVRSVCLEGSGALVGRENNLGLPGLLGCAGQICPRVETAWPALASIRVPSFILHPFN